MRFSTIYWFSKKWFKTKQNHGRHDDDQQKKRSSIKSHATLKYHVHIEKPSIEKKEGRNNANYSLKNWKCIEQNIRMQ